MSVDSDPRSDPSSTSAASAPAAPPAACLSGAPAAPPSAGTGLQDALASVVLFLVALPLCLGIALACGAPLPSGLVAGVVGGLLVGRLSSSELSVSGPAAGLVVIVVGAISTLGGFDAFLVAVALAGACQWLFGRLRLGLVSAAVPDAVVQGMLAAIGLLLVIKQVPVLLGFDPNDSAAIPWPDDSLALQDWAALIQAGSADAMVVALGSLAILALWETPPLRRVAWLARLPAPLIAVAWGVLYHAFTIWQDGASFAAHQRVVLPRVQSFDQFLSALPHPDPAALLNPQVYVVAATLAIVASLETLLSLTAADRLDPLRRRSDPDRELRAQGIGNLVSGLVGGLPLTAVIVRSSTNIQAGARTRRSAMLHGAWLLVSLLFLGGVLGWIPLASLSAVLVFAGLKLARPAVFVRAWREGLRHSLPFVFTLGAVVATDLLVGILCGLAACALFVLFDAARGTVGFASAGASHLLSLRKDVNFISRFALQRAFARVRAGEALIVDGSRCASIDREIRAMLDELVQEARRRGVVVEVRRLPAP